MIPADWPHGDFATDLLNRLRNDVSKLETHPSDLNGRPAVFRRDVMVILDRADREVGNPYGHACWDGCAQIDAIRADAQSEVRERIANELDRLAGLAVNPRESLAMFAAARIARAKNQDGDCCEPARSAHGIAATCCQNGRDRLIESRAMAVGGLTRDMQALELAHAEAVAARLVDVICELDGELANYDGAPVWYAR